MSSVLSYNDLNLAPVLEEGIRGKRTKSKDETLHETTFMKQFFYFLIMLIMNVRYEHWVYIFLLLWNYPNILSVCQCPQPWTSKTQWRSKMWMEGPMTWPRTRFKRSWWSVGSLSSFLGFQIYFITKFILRQLTSIAEDSDPSSSFIFWEERSNCQGTEIKRKIEVADSDVGEDQNDDMED